ncbi:MAG: ABC transporter permease [Actinobacteria bacterium]|nr:MAG: ABC transporter permease [Actinomycetota bacterium]
MSTPTAVRVWENHLLRYRKIWGSHMLGAFVQPVLYLLGMGVGVGALVDRNAGSVVTLDGVSYFAFLAPALLATTAMMSGGQTSLWEVADGFIWSHRYQAMASTPLTPSEIANGLALWHATRIALAVTAVAAVLALFEETRSWGLLLAVPVAVLTGLAFALPISAWSSSRKGGASFPAVIRFILIPMFLFGGAFFPVSQLPAWLQPVAYVTPLWHGIELCRGAVISSVDAGPVGVHIAVLVGYAVAGLVACHISFSRTLRP